VYLTATELIVLLPAGPSIGASTRPVNVGETGSVIAEIEAELDGAAAKAGYAVPISTSATVAFAQMQHWARMGAGAAVLDIIFPSISGPGGGVTVADHYRQAYQDALRALRRGETVLIGAAEDPSGAGRELPRSYSTSHPGATVGVEAQIDIDRVW
jgi:hypothetical protein